MKLYSHTVHALLGISLASVLAIATTKVGDWQRAAEPIEQWVDMRGVYVPDHIIGQEANVVYDRDIKRRFTADWTVTALPTKEDDRFICEVSGFKDYTPEVNLPAAGITMEFIFSSRPCKWKPGQFVLKTSWTIHREGYPDKVIRRTSNAFNVLAEDAMPYAVQQQIQELKEKVEQLEEVVK